MITKEGGELEVWREMTDQTDEYHSLIPTQATSGSRKTQNQAGNIKENTPSTNHLNHLIHHLNHLINHLNHLIHHLNQIGPQDLLQRWQNNTALLCKHHGKLVADLDSKGAEVS